VWFVKNSIKSINEINKEYNKKSKMIPSPLATLGHPQKEMDLGYSSHVQIGQTITDLMSFSAWQTNPKQQNILHIGSVAFYDTQPGNEAGIFYIC